MNLRSGKRKHNLETYVPRKQGSGGGSGNGAGVKSKGRKQEQELALLMEAMRAAPAVFANPGDLFEGRLDRDYCVIEYVGRNERPSKEVTFREDETRTSPKKGWLIFRNQGGGRGAINQGSGGVRDLVRAWPLVSYPPYDENGAFNEDELCIPAKKCGPLARYVAPDSNGGGQGGDDEGEDLNVSKKLLQEAKAAAPAIFAKPGDRFVWNGGAYSYDNFEPVVLTYVGRNEVPPEKVEAAERSSDGHNKPMLNWLVFKGDKNLLGNVNDSIRDGIGAWPMDVYSHYDEEGRRYGTRICLPPEMCGALEVYKAPTYSSLYGYGW